jgi:hypothetical protein
VCISFADHSGPEHSSAHVERFLQLSNEPVKRSGFNPNIHIVQPSTACQLFQSVSFKYLAYAVRGDPRTDDVVACSVLRRQMVRPYRKPLVICSPKSTLRLPVRNSRCRNKRNLTNISVIHTGCLVHYRIVPSRHDVAASLGRPGRRRPFKGRPRRLPFWETLLRTREGS